MSNIKYYYVDENSERQGPFFLEDLAKQGVAVIVVTSDLQELLRVSHRIIVMRKGDIVKEFKNVEVTQSKVLSAGQGVEEEAE